MCLSLYVHMLGGPGACSPGEILKFGNIPGNTYVSTNSQKNLLNFALESFIAN